MIRRSLPIYDGRAVKFRDDPPSARVRQLVAAGARKDAAEQARTAASAASAEELRAIVSALADALEDTGDRYDKRGRPEKSQSGRTSLRMAIAALTYRNAVTARLILDGDDIDPAELARFCHSETGSLPKGARSKELNEALNEAADIIAADIKGARELLVTPARELLKLLRLTPKHVERRGFRSTTLQRVAKANGVSERMLRLELAK